MIPAETEAPMGEGNEKRNEKRTEREAKRMIPDGTEDAVKVKVK